MDIAVTDSERDQIVSEVFEEVRSIYLGEIPLPWCLCTKCGEKHQCVCSAMDMSTECAQCRFKRRVAEREEELQAAKLAYRAEQLRDFAELN